MLGLRRIVKQDFWVEDPIHLESYWSYDLGDSTYASALLSSRTHWVRQLPGQLFHNIISHGIAKLAEFLDDELTEIVALARQSPQLRGVCGEEVLDELRVLIRDRTAPQRLLFFHSNKATQPAAHLWSGRFIIADISSGSLIRNQTGL